MFGYVINEIDVLMFVVIEYAHRLVEMQARKRRDGVLPQLRPDAKSQVTLRPYGILKMLDLLNTDRIRYRKTATYGHFGRENAGFTWEHTDKAEALRAAATL